MVGVPGRPLLAAAAVASAAALVLAPAATADTALWVQGASAVEIPLAEVLSRVPPGYSLQKVDYPAGLWPWTGLTSSTGAQSIAAGVPALEQAIQAVQGQGHTLVIGESLGSLVVDEELRSLAGRADAPDPTSVSFEVIADPSRPGGLLSYLPVGAYEPLTGTVTKPVPETAYPVTVIKLQYDAVASWPDRPWHLLSVVNALAGGILYHGTDHYDAAARDVMNGRVPAEYISTAVNSQGGTTTTYAVQQNPALFHLLEPVFPEAVAAANKALTPILNLGYSELTPDAGPHLAPGGRLVDKEGQPIWRPPATTVTAVRPAATTASGPTASAPTGRHAGRHRGGG